MHKLRLTPNGIFPIIYDKDGDAYESNPMTGYDFPGTIQGEGKLAGVPSLFIRTSGCNLSCKWTLPSGELSYCDSPESSIDITDSLEWDLGDVVSILKHNCQHIKHLVITGGEPTLQKQALIPFIQMVKEQLDLHITLESNGTHFYPELHCLVDLISLSPKLSSSFGGKFNPGHFNKTRENIKEVVKLRGAKGVDFQLKFVMSSPRDIEEIKELTANIDGLKGEDILLMPLGRDGTELNQTRDLTSLLAVENGWRFSPRLHIDIWGNKMGV